jgi:hypothetical protein
VLTLSLSFDFVLLRLGFGVSALSRQWTTRRTRNERDRNGDTESGFRKRKKSEAGEEKGDRRKIFREGEVDKVVLRKKKEEEEQRARTGT